MSYQSLAYQDAVNAGINPSFYTSLVGAESGWDVNAVSNTGAVGLAQIEPSTAADPGYGVAPFNPYDPSSNLQGGAAYFAALLNKFGSYSAALNAWNTGSPTGSNQEPSSLNAMAQGLDAGAAVPSNTSAPASATGKISELKSMALRAVIAAAAVILVAIGVKALVDGKSPISVAVSGAAAIGKKAGEASEVAE